MHLLESFDIYFLIICVVYGLVLLVKDYRLAIVDEDEEYKLACRFFGYSLIIIGLALYIVRAVFI